MIEASPKEQQITSGLGSLETENSIENSNVFVFFSTEFDALGEESDLSTKQLKDNSRQFIDNFFTVKELECSNKDEIEDKIEESAEENAEKNAEENADPVIVEQEEEKLSDDSTVINPRKSLTIDEIEKKDIENMKEQDFGVILKEDVTAPVLEDHKSEDREIEEIVKEPEVKKESRFDYNYVRTILVPTWLEQVEEKLSNTGTGLFEHLLIFTNLMIFLFAILQLNSL